MPSLLWGYFVEALKGPQSTQAFLVTDVFLNSSQIRGDNVFSKKDDETPVEEPTSHS